MLASEATLRAQEVNVTKALKVKAAYLYNFGKFVEWPEDAFAGDDAPFVIGIIQDDPIGDILDASVHAKKLMGRSIEIRRLRLSDPDYRSKLRQCHVLYIGIAAREQIERLCATLAEQPVLTVSSVPGFASSGGMIALVLKEGRIVFEINRDALEQAGLKASPKLLKLARIVKTDKHQ